ncbi:MAG: glycosyl hydrolase family 17 protein [Pirellulaceae bacterium]
MPYLRRVFLLALFLLATNASSKNAHAQSKLSKLEGICFSAIRDGESPALQINPLPSTVEQDVKFASRVTNAIRTYSVQGSLHLVPEFCRQYDIDCVIGAWIGEARWQNDAQIELLTRLANSKNPRIKSVIVGNEVLHRGDCTPEQLIAYVRQVKRAIDIPVGVAETWKAWVEHPELANEVDFCYVQAYPYWEGLPIDGAAAYTVDRLQQIRKMFPNQKIVLSEFGWPTDGEDKGAAIASPENAARYLREIRPLLEENGFDYYYFSLWDENWKVGSEGGVGAHWGLFHADGSVKPGLQDLLPIESHSGIERPPRGVTFELPQDEIRNASVLQAAYPQPKPELAETESNPAAFPARGAGLQSVIGSGTRIELPLGQGPSPRSALSTPPPAQPPRPALSGPAEDRPDTSSESTDSSIPSEVLAPRKFTPANLDSIFRRSLRSNDLYGVCLGLFRDNESPHTGVMPLVSELREDIEQAKLLARFVRTYSATESFSLVPDLCEELGVDCLPGAALGKYPWLNDSEIEMLIRIGTSENPRVKAVIVGNEVMHRGDFSIEQYIKYIRQVKRSVDIPVATAELLHTWFEHPELAEEVDILGVQIYPFWGGLGIDAAAQDTLMRVQELQAAHPGKRVMLTEFGWPTAGGNVGDAVASPENAARYFRETIPLLNKNGIEYFYFAMTDEDWKAGDEGGPGAHWGLLDSSGQVKPEYQSLLPDNAGISRSPRVLDFDE